MTEVLNSLGWALLHSLWQGCLAMCFVVAFRGFAEKASPSVRYTVQLVALAACLIAFFVTFFLYQNSTQSFESGFTLTLSDTISQAAALQISPSQGIKITSQNLTLSVAAYAPLLGLFWCLGFAFMGFKYMGAYTATQRLRTTGLYEPSEFWTNRFRTLRLNSGALEAARLYMSENVTGPMTIGFLKPIVLVPAGFLSGLPRDQVEAVLLHELAHIRRYDYLVNLFQTAIKTVLFFNPFIHYISRKIDIDREQACDDFAVAQTKNPHALALGLASLRLKAPSHSFIMAADNGDTPLTDRLGRLTGQELGSRPRSEYLLMPFIALLIMGCVYAASSSNATAHPVQHEAKTEGDVQKRYTIKTQIINGRDVTVKMTEDGRRWILVEGDWIDIDLSPDALDALIDEMPTPPEPPLPPVNYDNKKERDAFSDRMAQFEKDMAYFEAELERYFSNNKTFDDAKMKRIEEDILKAAKRAEIDVESIELKIDAEMHRSEKERARALQLAERHRDRVLNQAEKRIERAHEKAERERDRAMQVAERSEIKRARAETAGRKIDEQQAKNEAFRDSLYDYLIKDGYVSSRSQIIILRNANKIWTVNDILISADKEDKYCKLLSKNGIKKGKITEVTLEPNSTHIVSKSYSGDKVKTRTVTMGEYSADKNKHKTSHQSKYKTPHKTDHTPRRENPQPPQAPLSPGYPQPINYDVTQGPLAFVSPVGSQKITAKYGQTGSLWPKVHHGVDFKGSIGDPVIATASGVVEKASYDGNWGNRVIIAHKDGYQSLYAHMASITVSPGQQLNAGDAIGTVGSTGQSTGPHLHFEIRKDGTRLDPLSKIK